MESRGTTSITKDRIRSREEKSIYRSGREVILGDSINRLVKITVQGIPAPQGSKKVQRYIHGRAVLGESSSKVKPWRQAVQIAAIDQYTGPVITGPVVVSIVFYFPRPKSHYRTGKFAGQLKDNAATHSTSSKDGDIDKLARATCDALSFACGGSVIHDDSLIVSLSLEKRYIHYGELPGAVICIARNLS